MSHFTFASGVVTATVTARCPECNAVKQVPLSALHKGASAVDPCCSPAHLKVYLGKVRKAEVAFRQYRGAGKGLTKNQRAYIARTRSSHGDVAQFVVEQGIPFHKDA